MNNRSFKCFVAMVLSASMVFGCIDLPGLPGFSDLAPRILHADGNTAEADTWAGLQEAIDKADTGDTIVLTGNIEPEYYDTSALHVSGKEITIDLAGYEINRNLGRPEPDGYVISVYSGRLTVKGEGGNIRGGKNTGSGGCIYVGNSGSLVLEGGALVGNESGHYGGAVYCDGESVILDGTNITGNRSEFSGGGIYVSNGSLILRKGSIQLNESGSTGAGICADSSSGSIVLSGDYGTLDVTRNNHIYDTSYMDNIHLEPGQKISVSGTPNAHSRIGISTETEPGYGVPVVFASGAENDWSSALISDRSYDISWDGSDEIRLVNDRITGWAELQAAMDNGGLPEYHGADVEYVIRLTQDITAGAGDTYLDYAPSFSHPVTLDLNGFTIDRGLQQASANGYVMKISSGEMTITDSAGGGTITGGSNTGNGGGIYVGMTADLTMNGGTISGNNASENGGGVYVDNVAFFTQNGGSITGNKAAQGGGVSFAGTYTVSGNAIVTGNTDRDDEPSNIFINASGSKLTIGGDLSNSADLGLSSLDNYSVAVTEGFNAVKDTVDIYSVFTSDMPEHCLFLGDEDGEVYVGGTDSHTAGEPVWEWEDNLSGASASVYCEVCGGLIDSASTDEISDPSFDPDKGCAYVSATVTLNGEEITDRKDIGVPVFVEKTEPVIENGVYIPGTAAHFRIEFGNKVCFFEDNDGIPGDLITDLRLSYIEVSGSQITGYTLPIDPSSETHIEIPGSYSVASNVLNTLGSPEQSFFREGDTGGRIVMTDNGNITTVNAAAFSNINELELRLTSAGTIAVNGSFTGCGSVKILCYHSSGLEYGDHPDQGFTVEFIDDHTYEADPAKTEWSDDYESARICLVCSECGAEIMIDSTEMIREINADGTARITATGTLGDETYSAVLDNVPTWKITLSTGDEIRVPRRRTGADEYALDAVFRFSSVDPDIETPDYSRLAGWKNGNTVYGLDETITISCDMTYEAVWNTIWHEVQEALATADQGSRVEIKLYSDMTSVLGDSYLYIPESVSAVIDMNGYTITRHLPNIQTDGFVIKVDGDLVLKNGTVTGGNNTGNGGAVYVAGDLTMSEVSLYRNKALNGAGIFLAPADPDVEGSTPGRATMHRGSITYNYASKLGGGVYVSDGCSFNMTSEKYVLRNGKNEGGDEDAAVIIENNVAGEDGGGVFIERGGTAHVEGNPQIVNNTTGDANGEFNNVRLDPAAGAGEIGGMFSLGSMLSSALIGLTMSKTLLIKFIAVCVGVIVIAGVVYYFILDHGRKKDASGDHDQHDPCEHPARDAEWDWSEDYNTANAALVCVICGQTLHHECTPVITTDVQTRVTTYTATTEDEWGKVYEDHKDVEPYVVTLTDEIPSITKTELLPHLKDETVTYNLQVPPEFAEAHPHSTPAGWTDESGRGVPNTVEIDRDRNFNLKWDTYFAILYTPGADDIDPIEPVDWVCLVEKSKDHDLIENRYTRNGYDFIGYHVAAEGSVEPPYTMQPGDTLNTVQCDYTVTAQWRSKWDIFNESIGNNDNTELALTGDLNAKAEDVNLTVPSSRTAPLTIDLAGHTINRQLTENAEYGNAITVSDELTLTNGTIRGAANSGNGGAIVLNPGAALTMSSMTLTGNSCSGDGAGIYASDGSTINISGMLTINNPVHLEGSTVLNVTRALDPYAKITVTMTTPGIFTSGLKGNGSSSNFVSGDSRFVVGITDDGEACLYANVTFDKGDSEAKGYIPPRLVTPDSEITLPECSYTAPYGKSFSHWLVQPEDGSPYDADEGLPVTITVNTVITAVWDEITEPEFVYNTVVLSGQIGMSFYIYLPGDVSGYQDSYMQFTVNENTRYVPFDKAEKILIDGNPYYRFICDISSIQMAETITAEFHYGSGETITDTCSVKDYIDYILNDPGSVTPEEYDLVVAIGNLGHYCQPVLAEQNGWEYGVDYKTMPVVDPITYAHVVEAAEACSQYAISTDYLTDHNYIFYSLFLKSETMIAVYLATYLDGTVTAKVDGADADVEAVNGYYRVKIRNISADHLDDRHNVEFYVDGQKVTDTAVYALSYANSVLNSTGTSYTAEHKLCVTALYRYYAAAENYRTSTNGN